jgi:hypothetical protein
VELDSPSVLRVLRDFLHAFRSIHFVGGFLLHEVCEWSVLECGTVDDGGTVRGPIVDSLLLRVQY